MWRARCGSIDGMRCRPLALVGLALVIGTACASMRLPTVRKSFTDEALDRAVFEMQCPKEKIELVSLNPPLDETVTLGAQVGVKGCGKQVVYVAVRGGGWVANTASSTEGAGAQ